MILLVLLGCLATNAEEEPKKPTDTPAGVEVPITTPIEVDWSVYPFLDATVKVQSLQQLFPTPKGYQRVTVAENSFASWLRDLPVEKRKTVYSYRGDPLNSPAAAIVAIDAGRGDVQQCADSILRLYSEYRWNQGTVEDWGIHFTSGDLSTWNAWQKGERFTIAGSKVNRVRTGRADSSYPQYLKWLHHSFLYAGTRSLHKDARQVLPSESIEPGDFFVSAGSPGHAILVLDVAEKSGHPPVALLGQGFMPAQEFHVLADSGVHVISNWFALPTTEKQVLTNPSWSPFPRTGLYRFP